MNGKIPICFHFGSFFPQTGLLIVIRQGSFFKKKKLGGGPSFLSLQCGTSVWVEKWTIKNVVDCLFLWAFLRQIFFPNRLILFLSVIICCLLVACCGLEHVVSAMCFFGQVLAPWGRELVAQTALFLFYGSKMMSRSFSIHNPEMHSQGFWRTARCHQWCMAVSMAFTPYQCLCICCLSYMFCFSPLSSLPSQIRNWHKFIGAHHKREICKANTSFWFCFKLSWWREM